MSEDPESQALLPGMRKFVGYPKRDWRAWTNERGEKIDSPKYQGPAFYGTIVPLPLDEFGKPLELGDFRVLQRTDGRHAVVDKRAAFGDFSGEVVCGSRARARMILLACHRARRCQGPLARMRDKRGRLYELDERAILKRGDGAFLVVYRPWTPYAKRERAFLSLREAVLFLVSARE